MCHMLYPHYKVHHMDFIFRIYMDYIFQHLPWQVVIGTVLYSTYLLFIHTTSYSGFSQTTPQLAVVYLIGMELLQSFSLSLLYNIQRQLSFTLTFFSLISVMRPSLALLFLNLDFNIFFYH